LGNKHQHLLDHESQHEYSCADLPMATAKGSKADFRYFI
jgi:hypothetical protein